jgi:hypothetical protein
MERNLAPVIVFAYNRLDTLRKTIYSLQANKLASESVVYFFSDAAKSAKDEDAVKEIRNYLHQLEGFKEIIIIEQENNIGLANSIINGVSKIINQYGKVIVLEDDLLISANFLTFMNDALGFYEDNLKVYSISGFIFDFNQKSDSGADIFFTKRHCSWGWGMWSNRWNEIDWNVSDFAEFKQSKTYQKAFNSIGSDLSSSLIKQMNGQINSWAIRCNYHQFKKQTYTVYPLKSKVVNLGFGEGATHTVQRLSKYDATLDDELKYEFNFVKDVYEDRGLLKGFKDRYSKKKRLLFYLLNKFYK